MFTGIIEGMGLIKTIEKEGTNIHFTLDCPFTQELKIDQSLAHNGTCLTVVAVEKEAYRVTAIAETLQKTNLGDWREGSRVNLERCMQMNGRLDGHIVQGHVDLKGRVETIIPRDGSFEITISYPAGSGFATVPQGSITVNGISLTVARSQMDSFTVAIIPYTWENTNLSDLNPGDAVNLEFDIIGKYVAKLLGKL